MYKIYEKLRDARGITDYRVSKDTGIPRSTLFDWKEKKYTPKIDKLLILADYFGVPIELFIERGKE